MASIALGVVGAVVGSYFGNPMLGWSIGTTLGSVYDTLSTPGNNTQIGQLTDLRVSSSSYGTTLPFVWGGSRQAGTIIWKTDLEQHSSTQHQGGGSGGGGASQTTYSYTVSCAVAYAQGVLMMADGSFVKRNVRVRKIWADDMIVYDSGAPSGDNILNPVFYDGDESQMPDPTIASHIPNTPAYRGIAYFVLTDFDLTTYFSNRPPNFQIELYTDDVTVGDILSDMCGLIGLNSGTDFDFSDAIDPVHGYYIDGTETVQDSIDPLIHIFGYDISEYDGIIHVVKRGGGIALTIDEDDLAARLISGDNSSEDDLSRLEIKLIQDTELPSRLSLSYYALNRDYQANVQTDTKQDTETYNDNQLSTRFTFSDDEARVICARLIDTAWLERMTYQFTLPWRYIGLVPASLVWLPVNGILHRVRITDISIGLIGQITFGACEDDGDTLVQTNQGAGTGAAAPVAATIVPSSFRGWSGRELRDSDATSPGFYVSAHGIAGSALWRGGRIYYLTAETGATWTAASATSGTGRFGVTSSTLADSPVLSGEWDNVSTVNVTIADGFTLGSVNQSAVLNGQNVAVIGNEIIGFTTATLVSAGHYTLSGLLRGIRNSPMTAHTSTDLFILADFSLTRVSLNTATIGTDVQIKVLSAGQQLTDVTAETVTIATPTPVPVPNLTDLPDVDATDTTPGYVVTRQSDGSFAMEPESGGSFATLLDVDLTGASGTKSVVYDNVSHTVKLVPLIKGYGMLVTGETPGVTFIGDGSGQPILIPME